MEVSAKIVSLNYTYYSAEDIRKISVKEITNELTFDRFTMSGNKGGLHDPQLGIIDEDAACKHCNLDVWTCPGHIGHIEFPKLLYNPLFFQLLLKVVKITCFQCYTMVRDNYIISLLKLLGYKGNEEYDSYTYETFFNSPVSDIRKECFRMFTQAKGKTCKNCQSYFVSVSHTRESQVYIKRIGIRSSQKKKKSPDKDYGFFDDDTMISDMEATFDDFGNEILDNDAVGKSKKKPNRPIIKEESENVDVGERILPENLRQLLRNVWTREGEKLACLFPILRGLHSFECPTDLFFMEVLAVPAPYCRPPIRRANMIAAHFETSNLESLLSQLTILRNLINSDQSKAVDPSKFDDAVKHQMILVQTALNICYDNKFTKYLRKTIGFKQRLEKKEGLFRMNMMGKRVNFACRSVISPDPNLAVDEIGIPEVFARKLTFPEPVSPWNVERLRKLVTRGNLEYPGASSVIMGPNQEIKIPQDPEKRLALSKQLCEVLNHKDTNMIVMRHVLPGDMFVMNRQPSLHKNSMQTHKARIMSVPGAKTLRMHYSNCKAYNADFDGDEMNGHFVQTFDAKAEANCITAVPFQYLTAKDGSPLAGLIQDHVISGVKMTMRDRFFTLADYQEFLFCGLYDMNVRKIKMMPPAIVYPKRLWTGKQVFSTLIRNITPEGMTNFNLEFMGKKRNAEIWAGVNDPIAMFMSDVDLVIRGGEILTGMLDKSQIGASKLGLVHSFYECYGPVLASKLLTGISRVVNRFLSFAGFSMGLKDILLSEDADESRRKHFSKIQKVGPAAFATAFQIPQEGMTAVRLTRTYQRAHFDQRFETKKLREEFDRQIKSRIQKVQDYVCDNSIPHGLYSKFPENNLQFMIMSGAKGGMVNAQQMSVSLGQIEIEGKRIPLMPSGRTLPSFRPYDTSPRSGGLCTHRFLSGMPPQELYFHSMAGRDGLVDTAVKTSRSGYLQRSLIKHLEDLTVAYDHTVRDSGNHVVQFLYGDDGVDILKSGLLNENGFNFISNNGDLFRPTLSKVPETLYKSKLSKNERLKKIQEAMHDQQHSDGRKKRKLKPQRLVGSKLVLSEACPGEMVGLIAAQSIGEPSTQMTLNTFHLAGRGDMNVTLGIPRLREILMSHSSSIQTPVMSVPILNTPRAKKRVEKILLKHFTKLYLKDVVSLPIHCNVKADTGEHTLTFCLKERNEFSHKTVLKHHTILRYIEQKFFRMLAFAIKKQKASIRDHKIISKKEREMIEKDIEETVVDEVKDENADEIVESDDDDDKSVCSTEFEGENDERAELGIDDSSKEEEEDDDDDDGPGKRDVVNDGENEGENSDLFELTSLDNKKSKKKKNSVDNSRIKMVLGISSYYTDYTYDTSNDQPRWCRLKILIDEGIGINLSSLSLKVMESCVIHSVEGIQKVILDKEKEDDWILRTEGINFEAVYREAKVFDLNRIYTNNIQIIFQRYGIEAARAAICKEVNDVFGHYGIYVDSRHLSLISDYMTQHGDYKSFDRHSMLHHPSLMQKMTFETAIGVLKEAILNNEVDNLGSPSSSIITGNVVGSARNQGFRILSSLF